MDDTAEKRNQLLHLDNRDLIEHHVGVDPWLTVFASGRTTGGTFYCGLVRNEDVQAALEHKSWDLMIGDGLPGCSTQRVSGSEVVTYHRFGAPSLAEPLVILRRFDDLHPAYPEVVEEFRHFHNLAHDSRANRYIKFNETGDAEDVIRVSDGEVRIRLRELRQFLAIKEMHLAIYFDVRRFTREPLGNLGLPEQPIVVRDELMRYEVAATDVTLDPAGNKTISRLVGKKLIPPFSKEQSDFWPFVKPESRFAEFIVGVDATGEPVSHTCNPDLLSNNFNAIPGAAHYLTPVFFRREVLSKYVNAPGRFAVEDGQVACAGLWSVQVDTDLKDLVAVFLGDLGRDLPYQEQVYWSTFNVPPEGGISETSWRRNILGQFADPGHPEHAFKLRLKRFQARWRERFNWDLFKPLAADDAHLLTALHVPLRNEQAEFDAQVLALTKLLIDSLNERELERAIPPQPKDTKGITKLERFLESNSVPDPRKVVQVLRSLQTLRMGAAHRKGVPYRKAGEALGIPEKTLTEAFEGVLLDAVALLEALEAHLLQSASPAAPEVASRSTPSDGTP